jgi:hypothetical protein
MFYSFYIILKVNASKRLYSAMRRLTLFATCAACKFSGTVSVQMAGVLCLSQYVELLILDNLLCEFYFMHTTKYCCASGLLNNQSMGKARSRIKNHLSLRTHVKQTHGVIYTDINKRSREISFQSKIPKLKEKAATKNV